MIVEIKAYPEYSVDENGVVYGKRKKPIKPFINKNGYELVPLYPKEGQKAIAIHRLVAEAFIPNPDKKPFVNHIDGNKRNNRVENLEWVTRKENAQHAVSVLGIDINKNRKKKVLAFSAKDPVNPLYSFVSCSEAARWINREYGVKSGKSEIWKALNNKRPTARGLVWRYA